MKIDAREHAMRQWNAIACGELLGDKNTVQYFLDVEKDRYKRQPWQRAYFGFDRFAGKKVLEIGTGQGTDLMQFARAGAECYGVDITENHLALTARNFELQGKTVELFQTDATKLPFEDNSLDCVYSFGVIHHIPEAAEVFAEIHRVLRPGGTVMVAFYYKWSAFHLCAKIFGYGILRGWLLTKGYDGLLATIEDGADGVTTKPYVKLYSKQEMTQLLSRFSIDDVSVHQLVHRDFYLPVVGRVLIATMPSLDGRLGWYVASRATKP